LHHSSVVGYQNKALTGGAKNDFVVRTLLPVGKEWTDVTLGDLTGTDSGDVQWDYGADYLYTLKQNGLVDETYTYLCGTYAVDYPGSVVGWYTKSDADSEQFSSATCKNGLPLNFRQGFKMNAGSSGMTLNNAGEVIPKGWVEVTLTGGAKNDFTGNVTPVAIKIGDITGTDTETTQWDYGADYLYTLKQNGLVEETYTFLCATYAADYVGSVVGWYTKTDADAERFTSETCKNEAVEFQPGQAFKMNAGSSGISIYIPSALGTK